MAFLVCWGCVPRLDDCDDDTDCAANRVCSVGYCLPPDASSADAARIDDAALDAVSDATIDAVVDATVDAAVDAVVDAVSDATIDAAIDAEVVDAQPVDAAPACMDGESEQCEPESGFCDAGQRICREGLWSDCEGRVEVADEICNGRDDDCDLVIDEGFNLGFMCAEGVGDCAQIGELRCGDDGEMRCSAIPDDPAGPETCSGRLDQPADEDCDGRVDEAIGTGVLQMGVEVNVALDGAAQGKIAGDSHLDIAVTQTHTALLLNAVDAPPQLRVFPHRADGGLEAATSFVLPADATQLQVATRGTDFVVAGLLPREPGVPPEDGNIQPVYTAVVPADGRPIQVQVTRFPGRADGLQLVDSPSDRTIFFIHAVAATEVRMRALVDNENDDDRSLATPGITGAWAAATDGPSAYLIWVAAGALVYREFADEVLTFSIPAPLAPGLPAIVFASEPYIFSVSDLGELFSARVEDDQVFNAPRLDSLVPLPPVVALGLDGHFIISAQANGGGVISLHDRALRRGVGIRITIAELRRPPVVASLGGRGAIAWTNRDGEILIRPIWTGCGSVQPRPDEGPRED